MENEGSRRNCLEEIFFSGSMTGKGDFHGWRASCRSRKQGRICI
jgi:hypothetical protein